VASGIEPGATQPVVELRLLADYAKLSSDQMTVLASG